MAIVFERTDGVHSKVKKLTPLMVIVIRAEYDSGKRGKDHSWRKGIGAAQYNKIGRREAWKTLER